jgi:hypothetical protein
MVCNAMQSRPGRAVTRSSSKNLLVVDLDQTLDEPEAQPDLARYAKGDPFQPEGSSCQFPIFCTPRLQTGEHLRNCSSVTAS